MSDIIPDKIRYMLYPHKLLKRVRTRCGVHKIGELGTFYAQGDGTGNFFPVSGGFARIPCDWVQPVRFGPKPTRVLTRSTTTRKIVRQRVIRRECRKTRIVKR